MDVKEAAKEIALKHGEEMAKDIISKLVKPLAEDYIKNSENKIDDILLPFIDDLEQAMLGIADKIHE